MTSRMSQRAVYLVTAVIVASLVGGFAVATLSLNGSVNNSYQGSHSTNLLAVSGLTWVSTNLTMVPSPTAWGSVLTVCTPLSKVCNPNSGGYTAVCAGGFTAPLQCGSSDFVEQVNLSVSSSVAFPGVPVSLTVYVTGTPAGGGSSGTFVGTTEYFTEGVAGAPPLGAYILVNFDIGSSVTGPGAVTSVSIVATANS